MTQQELDHASRTQMKGGTQAALRDCLQRMDALNTKFYEGIYAQFEELGKLKSIEAIDAPGCGCATTIKRVEDYTPSQTDIIIQRFRRKFGDAKTTKLLDLAEGIRMQMILGNQPGNIGAMGEAYSRTIRSAYEWAHTKQSGLKVPASLRGSINLPAFPLSINYGGAFEKEVWQNGYELVTSKLTLNLLPEAMETISSGLATGQSWQQISAQLSYRYQGSQYHWTRLVRSEMAQAAHRASIEQYSTVPQLKAKWSTSKLGETCQICLALDGQIFKMDAVPALPHPQCRCVVVPTFAG